MITIKINNFFLIKSFYQLLKKIKLKTFLLSVEFRYQIFQDRKHSMIRKAIKKGTN